MTVIFLDIDGVLNRHVRHLNGYCGLDPECVRCLNLILGACPDVEIVVSSAWRYSVLKSWMTLKGFEYMLLTHGLNVDGRIRHVLLEDPQTFSHEMNPPFDPEYWAEMGLKWRAEQINDYRGRQVIERFVVLDDLPLEVSSLIKCDPSTGLTEALALESIGLLGGGE